MDYHYGLTTVFYFYFEGWLNVITPRIQRSPLGGNKSSKIPIMRILNMFNMLNDPMRV
jgi:hypothetical protein